MNQSVNSTTTESTDTQHPNKPSPKVWGGVAALLIIVTATVIAGPKLLKGSQGQAAVSTAPVVTVSKPLQKDIRGRIQLLGQFSAVDQVELRAQVGGTLTFIGFKDGDVVSKGTLLFIIDPTPYQIKLDQGKAQVATAHARLELANSQFTRS